MVSVAAIIARGVNPDGRREILGLGLGESEAQGFWGEFLRRAGPVRRPTGDLRRPRRPESRHCPSVLRQLAALPGPLHAQPPGDGVQGAPGNGRHAGPAGVRAARRGECERRLAAGRGERRTRFPKAAALLDPAEADVLAHLDFPPAHRGKPHSTNPLERLNKEVKRRAKVVGIFPHEASIRRLIGAVPREQNEEWRLQHRYPPQHTMLDTTAGHSEKDLLPAT